MLMMMLAIHFTGETTELLFPQIPRRLSFHCRFGLPKYRYPLERYGNATCGVRPISNSFRMERIRRRSLWDRCNMGDYMQVTRTLSKFAKHNFTQNDET